jgi:predicted nuclease of predicted toxin-antitoxin system
MLKLATDADIPKSLLQAVRQNIREVDILRVQDVGLRQAADAVILEWAASENRILITFDLATMIAEAIQRINRGPSMPGLICPDRSINRQDLADQMEMIVRCCKASEIESLVFYLPL